MLPNLFVNLKKLCCKLVGRYRANKEIKIIYDEKDFLFAYTVERPLLRPNLNAQIN